MGQPTTEDQDRARGSPIRAMLRTHHAEDMGEEKPEARQLQHSEDVPARILPADGHELPRLKEKTGHATADGG
jgi:hypothetical protein